MNPNVVVIDDELLIRKSLTKVLRARGYRVETAATGSAGVELVERIRPQVAILDMRLPDTDGVELLRRIRVTHPDLPVIITTAYMSIEPQLKVLDLPHSGYIVKPFRLDELGARIDAVV